MIPTETIQDTGETPNETIEIVGSSGIIYQSEKIGIDGEKRDRIIPNTGFLTPQGE